MQLPPELEAQFVVVEHEPPGRGQLEAIARGVATEPGELPEGDGLGAVLDAAAGLARAEAEGAFALSLVRHGRLLPAPLWEIKAGMLRKSGLLALHRGGASFAGLGGLDALKAFCSRALRPGRPAGVRARGRAAARAARLGQVAIRQGLRRLTADSIISTGDQDLTDVLGSMPSRCTAESNGGPSAYPERGKLKQHGIKAAAGPSCEGTPRRETRPPWSRLDCLNPRAC